MADLEWRTLGSKTLINDRWLKLRAETCLTPHGRLIEPYYVLDYPPWVNVIALTPGNEAVLVSQHRHGLGRTVLGLPSGTVEEGESPLEAVKRELREETGYGGGEFVETGRLSANPANQTNLTHSFLARGVEPVAEPKADEAEEVLVSLMAVDRLLDLARKGGLVQALHTAAVFLALEPLQRLAGRA